MTASEAQTLIDHIDAALGRAEGRLAGVVNERTTRVIDATTAVIGGLHEEIRAQAEALDALSANILARRAHLDARLAETERRVAVLLERDPAASEALGEPPLRDVVAGLRADVAAQWSAVLATRLAFGLLVLALQAAQWIYIAGRLPL